MTPEQVKLRQYQLDQSPEISPELLARRQGRGRITHQKKTANAICATFLAAEGW